MKKKKNKKIEIKKHLLLIIIIAVTILISSVFLILPENIKNIKTQLLSKYYGSGECVGYVERYYQNEFNIEIKNVGKAQNLFSMASDFRLFSHRNGGAVYPQPGDILVYSHKNKIGHVAIITNVKKDSLEIIEQNWVGSNTITRQTLPVKYENYGYTIFERQGYVPIGWLSRMAYNPSLGNTFFFNKQSTNSENSQGWIADNSSRQFFGGDGNWEVRMIGFNPTIMSPVFLKKDSSYQASEKIRIKAKILNNSREIYQGKIFLRNENDKWETEIPFEFNNNQKMQEVLLIGLRPDFEITQVRIQLNNRPLINREIWSFDWIYIK